MSTRTAGIWVAIAIGLALVAALFGQRGRFSRAEGSSGAEGVSTRLVERDLSVVGRMEIRSESGSPIVIERSGEADAWTVRRADGAPWPVESGRARAFLRVLGELSGSDVSSAPTSDASAPISLALLTAGGESIATIRLGSDRVAGLGSAWIESSGVVRGLRVPDVLHRALAGEAPMTWRDRRAFPALSSDVSRVRIRTPDAVIELARVDGRWGLRSPVVARADHAVVDGVIRSLQTLESDRFVEADPETFPDNPRIVIQTETDRRDPSGQGRWIETRTFELGGISPGGGAYLTRLLGARVRASDDQAIALYGPQLAEVRADRLSTVPGSPDVFISRTVVGEPASDVGLLRLGGPAEQPAEYRRTAGGTGWAQIGRDGVQTPVTAEDRNRLDELVGALCGARAEQVTILQTEDSLPGGIEVTLGSLSGAELERCSLFVDTQQDRSTLVARSGRVTRAYTVRPDLAAWIASR